MLIMFYYITFLKKSPRPGYTLVRSSLKTCLRPLPVRQFYLARAYWAELSNMAVVCAASRVLGRKIVSLNAVRHFISFAYLLINVVLPVRAEYLSSLLDETKICWFCNHRLQC